MKKKKRSLHRRPAKRRTAPLRRGAAATPAALAIRKDIAALAGNHKPFLPVADKSFVQCSKNAAILTNLNGRALMLPSGLLPVLA